MELVKIRRPFGLWDSAVTPASLAQGLALADLAWDDDDSLVWLEFRSGRGVLVCQTPDGQAPRDLNSEFSVRAHVGYGGGDFTVGGGQVYFADGDSGRIYRQPLAFGRPRPVTPGFGRMAAPTLSPDRRWLLFVRSYEGQDSLEIVDTMGEFWPQKLVSGDDFYMQPAWHPDGERMAWISWNHPNMPWDGASLRIARLRFAEGSLPVLDEMFDVAGDENTSVFQPEFSPDGKYLAYVSDASGWWQLYLHDLANAEQRQLTFAEAEHGLPAWGQGMRTYAFSPDSSGIFFTRLQNSQTSLWRFNLDEGTEQRLEINGYSALDCLRVSQEEIALIASGGSTPSRVITFSTRSASADGKISDVHIRRRANSEILPQAAYSEPYPIEWSGTDGGTAYGLFYAPHSQEFEGIGKPPLIVNVHGGPTSQATAAFSPRAQFFTSRGFAYLEVNHRGSTGFGRQYRDMLRGNWGIYDVQDAVSAARSLVEQGRVDGGRMVIMGGSAGGFTVLKTLEDFPGVFKAGICLFGVSNQFALAAETHKFEARYSDLLLGPLPEAAAIYRERSPIFFANRIQDAIAVFQGEDDEVVPRRQSDEIVASLRQRGVPHIYHVYPGEGHGFRKAETITHYYQALERFLKEYVIFA